MGLPRRRIGPTLLSDCVDALEAAGSVAVLAHPRVLEIDANGKVSSERNDAQLGLEKPHPHERLSRLYVSMAEQCMYGVIRTDSLRRTRRIQRTLADGYVVLTEFALQGPFAAVPAQSLYFRVHSEQHGGNRGQ